MAQYFLLSGARAEELAISDQPPALSVLSQAFSWRYCKKKIATSKILLLKFKVYEKVVKLLPSFFAR